MHLHRLGHVQEGKQTAPAAPVAPAVVDRTDPIDPRPISPENVFDVSKTDRNSDEAYQLERQSRTSPNLQKAKITDLVGKELVMEIRPGHTALQDKMGEGVKTMKIKLFILGVMLQPENSSRY